MSAYHDALQVLLRLRCPGCGTVNRPGVINLELNQRCTAVFCTTCAKDGPLAAFLVPSVPKEP